MKTRQGGGCWHCYSLDKAYRQLMWQHSNKTQAQIEDLLLLQPHTGRFRLELLWTSLLLDKVHDSILYIIFSIGGDAVTWHLSITVLTSSLLWWWLTLDTSIDGQLWAEYYTTMKTIFRARASWKAMNGTFTASRTRTMLWFMDKV